MYKRQVEVYPAQQLGSAQEMIEGMQMGTIEATLLPTAKFGGFDQTMNILDMPFLFPDEDTLYEIMNGELGEQVMAGLPDIGIRGCAFYGNGFKAITNNIHPIESPDDLKGLKIRTMEAPLIMSTYSCLLYTSNNESGLVAAAGIKRKMPEIKIVVVTSMMDSSFLQKAKQAGAESFWYKESSPEELLTVMDRTMLGESVYPDKAPEVQIGNTTSAEFTPGDLAVLRLLVKGFTDAAIAGELHISVSAVRWHIKELFEKTGYTNRVTLACDVINKDLIDVYKRQL